MPPLTRFTTLVIGLGHDDCGDDAAGRVVARRLSEPRLKGIDVLLQTDGGPALVDAWKGVSSVTLVETVYTSEPPGTIHRIDARNEPIPAPFFYRSSHGLCLAETVELARVLRQLPPRLVLFGIVGKSFSGGGGLSSAVATAVEDVAQRIRLELCPGARGVSASREPQAGGVPHP